MVGGVAGEEKLSCGNRYNVGPLRKTAVSSIITSAPTNIARPLSTSHLSETGPWTHVKAATCKVLMYSLLYIYLFNFKCQSKS